MNKIFLATFLMSLIFMSACGKKSTISSNSNQKHSTIKNSIIDSYEDLEYYTIHLDENTPVNLGTLLSADKNEFEKYDFGQCNWFLIGPSLAMTNAHCIPKILIKNPDYECGDYLQGVIQTEKGAAKRRCKKIIKIASEKSEGDYSVFEINEPLPGPFFTLSRSGIRPEDKVQIHTLHHEYDRNYDRPGYFSKVIRSTYVLNSCVIKNNTILDSHFTYYGSPVVGFKELDSETSCILEDGNSGAPVLNEMGNLVGIAYAGYVNEEMESEDHIVKGTHLFKNDLTKNFSLITNFACQAFNVQTYDRSIDSKNCAASRRLAKKKSKQIMRSFHESLYAKTAKFYSGLLAKLFDGIVFQVNTKRHSKMEYSVDIVPYCFKDFGVWNREELRRFRKNSFDISIPVVTMPYAIQIDYYGRRTISEYASKNLEEKIYEVSNIGKNAVRVGLKRFNNDGLMVGMFIDEIPKCSSETVMSYSKFLKNY